MALQVSLSTALPGDGHALAQLGHECGHAIAVALKVAARGIDVRLEAIHVNAEWRMLNPCQF